MSSDLDRQGHEQHAEGGDASHDAAAGKRTRSERHGGQRHGAHARARGGAAAMDDRESPQARAADDEHDDAFFFADGGREGAGAGNLDPSTMQALYYGINPPRHAEKAYQRGDAAPPLHPRPTTVGRSGTIVALATTIYNKPPFGRVANFSICDRGGRAIATGSVTTPGQATFTGLPPGSEVLIRPETMGTMVKLLTPEQIAGAQEEHAEAAGGAAGAHAADDRESALGGSGNLEPGTMQSLYYGINPPRHAEKAYQVGDPAPPLHPRPTTVGRSGQIVALATTIYNKPPFGKVARFSICDRNGGVLHAGEVKTPGQQTFSGLEPGTQVLIRPETIGTMVKLLTPEQIAGAGDGAREPGEGAPRHAE